MFSCECYVIFKATCFEEQLQKAASIRCYFDTINWKQSVMSSVQPILVLEQKYQNNLKNLESEKNSHIYNVYVIFY